MKNKIVIADILNCSVVFFKIILSPTVIMDRQAIAALCVVYISHVKLLYTVI